MGEERRILCDCKVRRLSAEKVGRGGAGQNEEGRRAWVDAHDQGCRLACREQRLSREAVTLWGDTAREGQGTHGDAWSTNHRSCTVFRRALPQ